MNAPLIVLIPSHDRDGLLDRTLASLSECTLPPTLSRIILAENGGQLGARELVAKYASRLPLEYRYTAVGNKSIALNEALAGCTDEFVVFCDDDCRIEPQSLMAYAERVHDLDAGVFLGGRCVPEFEEPPPDWLFEFLPASAKGWSLGDSACPMERPEALGCNWAAFASDILKLGGFNPNRGPGTRSRGQERDMQSRLLSAGIKGWYIPEAVVAHHVPRDRCSPEWALNRAEQMGAYHGMEYRDRPFPRRLRTRIGLQVKVWGFACWLHLRGAVLEPQHRFRHQFRIRWLRGAFQAMVGP